MVLNFDPIPSQNGLLLIGKNNMGSNNDFSYLYEPNTCLIDALNLTNGPIDDWDSNLESFSSTRDFVPSSNISIYGICFGWILDIWDFIDIKNNNSYDLAFGFSLVMSKLFLTL